MIISWPSYAVIFTWIVVSLTLGLGKLVAYCGAILLSLPMVLLAREGAAVELGEFGTDESGTEWIECRFRSPQYAEAFASVNHVTEHNTENFQEELELAIKSIQELASRPASDGVL
jgi:hypothetical protein